MRNDNQQCHFCEEFNAFLKTAVERKRCKVVWLDSSALYHFSFNFWQFFDSLKQRFEHFALGLYVGLESTKVLNLRYGIHWYQKIDLNFFSCISAKFLTSCRLVRHTANPAQFWWKWAKLAVLFSRQLLNGSQDFFLSLIF